MVFVSKHAGFWREQTWYVNTLFLFLIIPISGLNECCFGMSPRKKQYVYLPVWSTVCTRSVCTNGCKSGSIVTGVKSTNTLDPPFWYERTSIVLMCPRERLVGCKWTFLCELCGFWCEICICMFACKALIINGTHTHWHYVWIVVGVKGCVLGVNDIVCGVKHWYLVWSRLVWMKVCRVWTI